MGMCMLGSESPCGDASHVVAIKAAIAIGRRYLRCMFLPQRAQVPYPPTKSQSQRVRKIRSGSLASFRIWEEGRPLSPLRRPDSRHSGLAAMGKTCSFGGDPSRPELPPLADIT